MDKQEFKARMDNLLPDYDREAMKVWHEYAGELDADALISQAQFYDNVFVEFSLVAGQYGAELATELFSIANISCLNAFEVRGASHYLHDGAPLDTVAQLAIDGKCDSTVEEEGQFKDALAALQEEIAASKPVKPSILAQLRENRQAKKIEADHKPPRNKSGPEL